MRTIPALLTLGVGLAAAGCNPIYYSPNTQNVLIAPERGELMATAAADGNRVELQAAYAVTDALALQFNAGRYDQDDLDNGDGGTGDFFEFGAGYAAPLQRDFSWELHALLGFGSLENHFPSTVEANPQTTGEIRAGMVRVGVQPAIGYRSRYVEAALSSRIVALGFRDIEGSLVYEGEDQTQALNDAGTQLLVEPAFTLRAGLERVKVQFQTVRSVNLSDSDFRQDDSMATIGIVLSVPTR